jgi:hypothetical protein
MVEDGLWVVFLLNGRVLVPTMAKTKAGFYMGIEPVELAETHEPAAVEQAVIHAVTRGNPSIPTPAGGKNFPKSPLLKYTKLKSLSTFDKLAKSWSLSKRHGAYLIVPDRLREDAEGGKEEDMERGEAIPAEVPLEAVVHRFVSRVLGSDDRKPG